MGCLCTVLLLLLWVPLGRGEAEGGLVVAAAKVAGCDELGEIDVAGNVCPWQYGAHAVRAATTPGIVWCVLDSGWWKLSDIKGFVKAMFPHGGYYTKRSKSSHTWALFGPNCSYDPVHGAASAGSDVLSTPDEGLVRYHATVGNGAFASEMNAASVFLAGVFNGPDAAHAEHEVSHRAAVPNPLSAAPAAPFRGNGGASLDLRRAVYTRRSRLPPTRRQPIATLEQRFYAHRARPSLMVMEMEVFADGGGPISVTLHPSQPEFLASDFDVERAETEISVGGEPVRVSLWTGVTRVAETGADPVEVTVAVPVAATGNWTLEMRPGQQVVTAAVIRSTMDAKNYSRRAVPDELREALEDLQRDLSAEGGLEHGAVRRAHESAWAELWSSGFEVEGRPHVAQAVNSSLYYILSSLREDYPYSLSPGGLASNGYNGHTFWDTETWMYPPLLAWHPPLARSLLKYREARLGSAHVKARSYSPPFGGAMFPWESASSGHETCPNWAATGRLEHHISADIAVAARQYLYMTGDTEWLQEAGYPILAGVADFWVSRAEADSEGGYHIRNVIPPDEYSEGVDDSVYTNYAAKEALVFAIEAASIVGADPVPGWAKVAANLVVLFNETEQVHPEYAGYAWGKVVKQADVVLLPLVLGMEMSKEVQINDLHYYAKVTDFNGPAMTWGAHATGYLRAGALEKAARNFDRSFANVRWPFYVWSETPTGGTTNFITGAGGFLQTVIFGYSGVTIHKDSLEIRPTLLEGATAAKLRGLHYHGRSISISYDGHFTNLTLEAGAALQVQNDKGLAVNLSRSLSWPAGRTFWVMAPPTRGLTLAV